MKVRSDFESLHLNMRTCTPRDVTAPEKLNKIDVQDPKHEADDEEDN